MFNLFKKKPEQLDLNVPDKPKAKPRVTSKERWLIVAVFILTIILSLLFYLKAEVVYWYQNWQQPEIYHIE